MRKKEIDILLCNASEHGDLPNVLYALQNGADVHVEHEWSLRLSSLNGYTEIVQILLKYGADVNAFGTGALCFAAIKGRNDIVNILINHGANVWVRGGYPMILAAQHGHVGVMKILSEVDAKLIYCLENAPIRIASQYGREEAVRFLIDRNADVHSLDEKPLYFATINEYKEIIKILVSAGADTKKLVAILKEEGNKDAIKFLFESLSSPSLHNQEIL